MFEFLQDVRIVLTIFGLLLIYKWVAENIPSRTLAVLVLLAATYYFLFYSPDIFTILIIFAVIVFFGGPIGGMMQDLIFQYGSARELQASPEEEMKMLQQMQMTPYGPRWKR